MNNVKLNFEFDCGSGVSTLRLADAHRIEAAIIPSDKRMFGYGGFDIKTLGQTTVNFSYKGYHFKHTFVVVDSNCVNLFGRDLAHKLEMYLEIPNCVNNVSSVLSEFKDYLSDDFQSNVIEEIKLEVDPNATPVFCKARTVPVRLKEAVKTELNRLVEAGKITKVYSSNWSSPIVSVLKSDNTVRICTDFSNTVNKYLQPVQSPLVSIDDVIAQVGDARVFSAIDCKNAFLQLKLDDASKEYCTFNCSDGLYRFNYLPYGLSASPGIFQAFMSKILNGIDNVICYLDDVLILTPTIQEHNVVLRKVLQALQKAGVKINGRKSKFYTDKVTYLGHEFDKNGVHPSTDKIDAIVRAPAPCNLKQLQAFLGLTQFYSRFIKNFSHVMEPLYRLLKKDAAFIWGTDQEKSFNIVKGLFKTNKVLKLYNPKFETLLETDSSGYGCAGVLMQRENSHKPWHPVQFVSRTLNSSERNFSNLEREALSVLYSCEKLRKFLLGSHFIIKNDHKPLEKLFKCDSNVPENVSARLQRWRLRLSQFKYTFQYAKGKDQVHSDCLSRLPLPETVPEVEPYELIFTVNTLQEMSINCLDIAAATDNDNDLKQLKGYIKNGWPTNPDSKLNVYKKYFSRMSIMKGCILYDNRVLIPATFRKRVLENFHEGHPGIVAMKSLVRGVVWYPGIDNDVENLVKNCSVCQLNRSKPAQKNTIEWPQPKRPWSKLHIDHFFIENKTCLVVVDSHSKYIECEIVKSTSAGDSVNAMRKIFSRNGLCDTLVSDNATSFVGKEFQEFLKFHGIRHITPPPGSPSSNGQGEVSVRIVKNLLKKSDSKEPFETRLVKALFYYRTVPHNTTQIPPCVMLNSRRYITAKDRLNPKYYDFAEKKSKVINKFDVGDNVLALNLREGQKWLEATVVGVSGTNIYEVHVPALQMVWRRHANQLLLIPRSYDINTPTSSAVAPNTALPKAPDKPPDSLSAPDNVVSFKELISSHCPHSSISNDPVTISNDSNLRRSSRHVKPPSRLGIDD